MPVWDDEWVQYRKDARAASSGRRKQPSRWPWLLVVLVAIAIVVVLFG